jgi:regulation of enolase protein 1 (concanavalin A-like superfamily)
LRKIEAAQWRLARYARRKREAEMETASWRNEPPFWQRDGEVLTVRTSKETDFWNNTFYGFKHVNGHFLAERVSGDFTIEAEFSADYRALYD